MKKITLAVVAILLLTACKKESIKVSASSVSNSLGIPYVVEFDTAAACYDGTNYNTSFIVYGGHDEDSVWGGLTKFGVGDISHVFLGTNLDLVDTFNISIASDITSGVQPYAYVVVPDEEWGSKGAQYNSSIITQSCGNPRIEQLRKKLWERLKDKIPNGRR